MIVRTIAAAALAGFLSLQPAAAQFDEAQTAALRQASIYLTSIEHVQGDFTQIGPSGERTTGKFYISRPGKVRFDYASPSTLQVIADGSAVAVRDRNLATQDIYPLGQTPLRYLLDNRIDLVSDTQVIAVHDTADATTIVIEDTNVTGTGRLAMTFAKPNFEMTQWTVTDPQGLETTVAISNVVFGEPVAARNFEIRYERPLN